MQKRPERPTGEPLPHVSPGKKIHHCSVQLSLKQRATDLPVGYTKCPSSPVLWIVTPCFLLLNCLTVLSLVRRFGQKRLLND